MNSEIGQHPGFFLFLNRLNTAVFEQGINAVAQANAEKVVRVSLRTQTAKKLVSKAAKLEEDYAAGLISPTELVRAVASHFDEETLDVLDSMSAPEELNFQGSTISSTRYLLLRLIYWSRDSILGSLAVAKLGSSPCDSLVDLNSACPIATKSLRNTLAVWC